jgi:hypothetical protein
MVTSVAMPMRGSLRFSGSTLLAGFFIGRLSGGPSAPSFLQPPSAARLLVLKAYRAAVHETPYRREPGYALRYRDLRFQCGHGPRTDRRERAVLRRLLARADAAPGPWLDVPSGAGRLSLELPGPVVQVDRNPAMLRASRVPGPRVCASAAALPFLDGAFAGVLCCRLLQHVAAAAERVRILAELGRVSRGVVVVTFFDAHSLQHGRRLLRRALGKARSGRSAVSRAEVARDVRAAGLLPLRFCALRRFVGEQTFLLCRRAR